MPKCKATSKRSGQPCKRDAIKGGTVCATHGGRAPQVANAATRRLLDLVDPALAALHKILTSNNKHTTNEHRIAAAKEVLNRVRHTAPVSKQEFSGPEGGPIQVVDEANRLLSELIKDPTQRRNLDRTARDVHAARANLKVVPEEEDNDERGTGTG